MAKFAPPPPIAHFSSAIPQLNRSKNWRFPGAFFLCVFASFACVFPFCVPLVRLPGASRLCVCPARLPSAVFSCAFHVPCPLASPLRVFLVLSAMLAVAFDQATTHTACGSGRATPEPRSPGQSRYGFPYVLRCLRHIVGGRGGRGHARQLLSSSSGSFAPLILAESPLCAPGYVVSSLCK